MKTSKIAAAAAVTTTTEKEKVLAAAKEAGRKAKRALEHRLALAAAKEVAAEKALAEAALREAFFKNDLPRSAHVRESGRQVVVTWLGRSVTFYRPALAA